MNIDNIIFALLFFLPAGISNMTPVFSSKIPYVKNWNTPLDFGKSYRGQRVFGKNKTWRGLLSGVVLGTLTGYILSQTYFTDYDTVLFTLLAASMSFGALAGDAVESFFKRQRGIPSGKPWFPFDQTDYIIGGLLFTLPVTIVPFWVAAWVLALYFGLHLLSSYIGYLLGLKELPI